jgi:uncharacterized membrane protein YfcA
MPEPTLTVPVWSWWIFPLLFLTGAAAGFVDSIAGGGGVITIPVLLNLGMPAQLALGTNKLQASFGSGSAAWHYRQAGLVQLKDCRTGILMTLAGAALGSLTVSRLHPDFLQQAIPWLLLVIVVYLMLQPKVGLRDTPPRLKPMSFYLLFGALIGFYDGFFGPGTGTFWAMAFVTVLGLELRRATAHTKLMNFTSNVVSLAVFAAVGQVDLKAGICMGLGQCAGARLGSRLVIHRGVRWIRPIFIAAALVITARLLWLNFFSRFS